MSAENITSPAVAQQIACAYGENVKSGVVRPFVFQSLRAFAGWLKGLAPVTNKLESKYLVGATFSGHERTLNMMTGATMLQCDFDKVISPEQHGAVCAALTALNIAHVSFETFSNGGRFVVLIPLSRPATATEHRATMEWVMQELGPYAAGLDQASFNPVLPRFVSPNAANSTRLVTLNEGRVLPPVAVQGDEVLPANVLPIAPIPSKPAVTDRFALYEDQASPEQQQLFLAALRANLLPLDRLDEYPRWFPVIYAGFRAWAVNSTNLTEGQKELVETLNLWSSSHPKYKTDAISIKLKDWLRDRGTGSKPLHVQSILTHEVDGARLREALISDDKLDFDSKIDLTEALDKLIGAPEVTVVSDEALAAALTKIQKQDEANAALRLRGLTFISRAPQINGRFDKFLDILTAFATQNKAERWELTEDEWEFFPRPAPILISLCQAYAMGFAPHVMFRLSAVIEPKALNLFFMNIAPAGTGKSSSMNLIRDTLSKTVFKNLAPSYKLHSATGLWLNAFERHGPLQLVTSDEAESLIGKQGQKDQHLLALQTAVKQLYDAGIPGRKFRPSAQVQRELREITAPVMSLNVAATPALLREDIGGAMLNDGFVSRMIVSIDDRERRNESEEETVKRKVDLITSKTNDTLEHTIEAATKFFNESWRSAEAKHPSGRDFFTVMGDEGGADLAGRISAHFERPDLPVRCVTPPTTPEGIQRFATIITRAETCWAVPPGMRGTDAEANIESLRVRAVIKLCVLSTILTLVADPAATEVNLEIMEWAADILYCTQHPFYRHLMNASESGTSMLKARLNPTYVDKLRPAVAEGGPLRQGVVSATILRDFSRPWRKLISDLRLPESHERRRAAEDILDELEVKHEKRGNTHVFYMTKGLDCE